MPCERGKDIEWGGWREGKEGTGRDETVKIKCKGGRVVLLGILDWCI